MNMDLVKLIAERAGYRVDVFGNGYWNSEELIEYSKQMILESASILNNAGQSEAATILLQSCDVTQ